jgi:tetratricopeptide (TPR) repeat protein
MERGLFLIGLLIVIWAIYRFMTLRLSGPQARVRALLRHYHSFEKTGLSEQESLFKVLIRRSGWRNLPPAFLAGIVTRLRSKENVFRFVSLAEGYRFHREHLPAIVAKNDMEGALREIAVWLVDFGTRMQNENRLKEAEFVQKLALSLQPDQFFTKLPLATTYYKMEKYADALPLFEEGLAELDKRARGKIAAKSGSLLEGIGSEASLRERRPDYEEMYAACLKTAGN